MIDWLIILFDCSGQVVNAMRKILKIQLSVADLFSAPTIESLAYKVSSLKTLESSGKTETNTVKKEGKLLHFLFNSII